MGKGKKRPSLSPDRGGAVLDSQDSTPSEDEQDQEDAAAASSARCPHVGKAVHVAGLKKTLKTAWVKIGACGPCAKEQRGKEGAAAAAAARPVDPAKPVTVWICLRCGLQLCDSNSTADHFSKHQVVPRSDSHCLNLNVTTWKLWCHECAAEVRVDSYKKLREAVDFVRKIEETKGRAGVKVSSSSARTAPLPAMPAAASGNGTTLPRVRGLSNLGNTCFFNAVMQSLTQTHPLTHALDQHCLKGVPFHVPAVQVMPAAAAADSAYAKPAELYPLALQLSEGGPISMALAAFVKDMNSVGKQGVVNPGHLFGQVCRKAPQFRGFHQQDAHELLRQLMEGLRGEEAKRQKSAILKHFDLSEKTDPKSVSGETRRKLQALGRHSNYTIVDKIFGGHLVSTIVCEQCHNSSQIYEPFLDLSLPLIEEKPQRPHHTGGKRNHAGPASGGATGDDGGGGVADVSCFGRKKRDSGGGDDDGGKSKYQLKKEKAKSKKDKRRGKKNNNSRSAIEEEEGDVPTAEEAQKENEDVFEDAESEEAKLKKDLEESEKNETSEVYVSGDQIRPDEFAAAGGDESSAAPAADQESTVPDVKGLTLNDVCEKSKAFEKKADKKVAGKATDGNDEDDEDDGYSEGEEDWEWDYGEEWEEGDEEKSKGDDSIYLEAQPPAIEDTVVAGEDKPKLVSMNPLPQELLDQISAEREKSSEPMTGDNEDSDSESSASGNGDVEDNLDDPQQLVKRSSALDLHDAYSSSGLRNLEPFRPDPQHLDPHMEQLCRKVRKMSVASVNVRSADTNGNGGGLADEAAPGQQQYVISEEGEELEESKEGQQEEQQRHTSRLRLQNDWVARSLTSIAPRYQSQAGECSVYSCLTQFTAPELLTGNNKWACDRCTSLQKQKGLTNGHGNADGSSDEENKVVACCKGHKSTGQQQSKSNMVYSNASKQLLIFSPPAVLTIHLKRFQQTMFNLRKVNRHVDFPLRLDLAPFCSSTSLSTPNVRAGVKEILYDLYAIVEHSGRLQGGHYTAFVKARPAAAAASATPSSYADFYSAPTAKTEEIHKLLVEIARKCQEEVKPKEEESVDDDVVPAASKWYYISDGNVSEVSEDKVLKSQAYLLFYERIR